MFPRWLYLALAHYEIGLRLLERAGDRRLEAIALGNLGTLQHERRGEHRSPSTEANLGHGVLPVALLGLNRRCGVLRDAAFSVAEVQTSASSRLFSPLFFVLATIFFAALFFFFGFGGFAPLGKTITRLPLKATTISQIFSTPAVRNSAA